MSRARSGSLTAKSVKNKTGVDMFVPTSRQVAASITEPLGHAEYTIGVRATAPQYKPVGAPEDEVNEFMVTRRYSEFEVFYAHLVEEFPGDAFPILPAKNMIVTDNVIDTRRAAFETLIKFLARDPRYCACNSLLDFLSIPMSQRFVKIVRKKNEIPSGDVLAKEKGMFEDELFESGAAAEGETREEFHERMGRVKAAEEAALASKTRAKQVTKAAPKSIFADPDEDPLFDVDEEDPFTKIAGKPKGKGAQQQKTQTQQAQQSPLHDEQQEAPTPASTQSQSQSQSRKAAVAAKEQKVAKAKAFLFGDENDDAEADALFGKKKTASPAATTAPLPSAADAAADDDALFV
eukprot:Opistho-2@83356